MPKFRSEETWYAVKITPPQGEPFLHLSSLLTDKPMLFFKEEYAQEAASKMQMPGVEVKAIKVKIITEEV